MTDDVRKAHAPEGNYMYIVNENIVHYLWVCDNKMYLRFYNETTDNETTVQFGPDTTLQLLDYVRDELVRQKQPKILDRCVSEFDFTVRTKNCFRNIDIVTVRDLVRHSAQELLRCRNFGRHSLREVQDWLEERNLFFGMDV